MNSGRCTPESPLAALLASSSAFSLSPRLRHTSHTLTAASWPALARYLPFLLNFIVQITPVECTVFQDPSQEHPCAAPSQASARAQSISKQSGCWCTAAAKIVGEVLPLCALSSWMMQRCVSSLTSLECACTFTGLSGPRPEGEAGPLLKRLKEDPVSICAIPPGIRQPTDLNYWDDCRQGWQGHQHMHMGRYKARIQPTHLNWWGLLQTRLAEPSAHAHQHMRMGRQRACIQPTY